MRLFTLALPIATAPWSKSLKADVLAPILKIYSGVKPADEKGNRWES
jgi:hypothetical protein